MKITTPHGTLEGDTIEAILKEHGFHCLHGADLRGAYLRHADLRGADLRHASLHGAYLMHADLRDADLCDADLRGADLYGADLHRAYDVKLSIAKISILPDEGDIIGWKKHGQIMKCRQRQSL